MYAADPDLQNCIADRLPNAQNICALDEMQRIGARDRRGGQRFRVDETASLYSTDPMQKEEISIQVLDVSRKGLRIATCQRLRFGSNVRVHLKDMLVIGEIRYCQPKDELFQAGILIESVLRRV